MADSEQPCTWTQDFDGCWDTSCGEKHVLETGGPKENKMIYCCYCGKELVEASSSEVG